MRASLMNRQALVTALAIATLFSACKRKTPEAPGVTPGTVINITGVERLGWTQRAGDSAELSRFRFAIYVDGARTELTGVSCARPARSSLDFECSAPLPAMSAGPHTLELASFTDDAGVLESVRSGPLQVNKTTAASSSLPTPRGRRGGGTETSPAAAEWPTRVTAADGLRLRLEPVARGFVNPTDIAFMSDGRMLVAEETGRVRVVLPDGQLLPRPALSLADIGSADVRVLSLAVDPQGFVYVVYTVPSPSGVRVFTLARFREASNLLFGQIVLRDNVEASTLSAASLRIGADGKVFVAFDDGGDPQRAGDFASPNGKILRLNADGTTPEDQAGLTPMYLADLRSPHGLDWRQESSVLWILDQSSPGQASITAVGNSNVGTRKSGVRLASYSLPRGTEPSSLVAYHGALIPGLRNNLLIASNEGRHLLRLRLDAANDTKVIATERLLQNTIGGIRVVALSPGGAIYIATADTLAMLGPEGLRR
jgi:glucose/arabinose dehydrogenase